MFKMTKTSSSENGGGWPVSARMFAVAAALVSATLATPNVFAAAIPVGGGGVLQLSNLTGQLVGVNASCINWGQPAACQTTTGIQDSVSGSDPALFTVGSTALDTIKDLPFGVATPLVGFMTVQSPLPGGQVLFDLNSLVVPGAFGNCTVLRSTLRVTLAAVRYLSCFRIRPTRYRYLFPPLSPPIQEASQLASRPITVFSRRNSAVILVMVTRIPFLTF